MTDNIVIKNLSDTPVLPICETGNTTAVLCAGVTSEDEIVRLQLDKEGRVIPTETLTNALAQMMTNQVVILNAVDSLVRRSADLALLEPVKGCVAATVMLQSKLLGK